MDRRTDRRTHKGHGMSIDTLDSVDDSPRGFTTDGSELANVVNIVISNIAYPKATEIPMLRAKLWVSLYHDRLVLVLVLLRTCLRVRVCINEKKKHQCRRKH